MTDDDVIDIRRKTVAVTDDFMANIGKAPGDSIMLHRSCREGRMSHNTVRRSDDGRWFVRKGKRGGTIRYLTTCVVTYQDGAPVIHVFKTDYAEG